MNTTLPPRTKSEKSKKSRKMTKLSIIKAAISHIYSLQEMLHSTEDCLNDQGPKISDAAIKHLPPLLSFTSINNVDDNSRENSVLRKEEEQEVHGELSPEDNNVVEGCYYEEETVEEYKVIPIEQEFSDSSSSVYTPPIIYVDCYASIYSEQIW